MRRLWLILIVSWQAMAWTSAQSDDSRVEIAHTVVAGESLSVIAAAYGVTVDEIATANSLDPEAILRVGERLVIVFSAAGTEAEEETPPPSTPSPAPPDADADPAHRPAIGSIAHENDLPPAPVIAADFPAWNPARFDAAICAAQFDDANQNGTLDPGEDFVAGGTVMILPDDGAQHDDYALNDAAPLCVDDLLPRVYTVAAHPPPGYGLTGSASLRVDLRDAVPPLLHFGLKRGLELEAPPVDAPPAPAAEPPREEAIPSPLRQLSGLFVLAAAGLALVCGFVLALFLRFR